MKIKVKKSVETATIEGRADEYDTPDDIEAAFSSDNSGMGRRRSMQLSVPDPTMAVFIRLQNAVVDISFSEATRAIWKPYLDVLSELLQEGGFLNEFGNIAVPIEDIQKKIETDRLTFLRAYVLRCKKKNIPTDWICTTEL
jgi:hypothetical protein